MLPYCDNTPIFEKYNLILDEDTIVMQLPLLGCNGVIHDWNYLLTTFSILKYTHAVALTLYLIGLELIAIGICFSMFFALQENEPMTTSSAS